MNAHRSLLAVLILLSPLLLRAQVYESDNLFIPPTITVVDMMTGGPPLLKATEQHVRRRDPMLPIIFFDNPGEWTLPPRYHTFGSSSEADGYADTNEVWLKQHWYGDINAKPTDTNFIRRTWSRWEEYHDYPKYYELLDVIGYRMTAHPQTSITLRGGYSAEPGESPDVARERITTVRDYLTSIWRIAPERITVGAVELLSDASDHIFDHQEARMVAIDTESWEVIRPVEYSVKWGRFDDNGLARFVMTVRSNVLDRDVDSILVRVYDGEEIISQGAVPGSPGMMNYDLVVVWHMLDYMPLRSSPPLTIDVHVRTTDGVYRRSLPVRIPWETSAYSTPLQPDRLVLPFYRHGDTALTDYPRKMLDEIMVESIDHGKDPADAVSTMLLGTFEEWESHLVDEKLSPRYYGDLIKRLESQRSRPHRIKEKKDQNESFTLWRRDLPFELPPAPYDEDQNSFTTIYVIEPAPDYAFRMPRLNFLRLETLKAHILATYSESTSTTMMSEEDYIPGMAKGKYLPLLPEQRWYRRSVALTLFDRRHHTGR